MKKDSNQVKEINENLSIKSNNLEINNADVENEFLKVDFDLSKLTDKQMSALREVELEQLKLKNKRLRQKVLDQKTLMNKQNIGKIQINKSGAEVAKNTRRLNLKKFELQLKEYLLKRVWKDVGLIVLGSLLCTIAYDYFIGATTNNGLFPPGVAAISRQLSIITTSSNQQNTLYFLYYIGLNLPLFIFGIFKVGVKFSVLTIIGLAIQNVFNIIIAYIPVINPNELKMVIDYVYESNFIINNGTNAGGTAIYLVWIFVFALIGAILYGVAYSLLYMAGGSSAGTDFVSAYFQNVYNKSIATINRSINIFIVLFVILIHTLVMSDADILHYFHADKDTNVNITTLKIRFFFGPTTFGSLLFVFVQALVTNAVYPKFKFRSLTIYTIKGTHLVEALSYKGFNNLIQISECTAYYKENIEKVEKVTLTINMIDYKKVLAIARVIDPASQFVSRRVDRVDGNRILRKSR